MRHLAKGLRHEQAHMIYSRITTTFPFVILLTPSAIFKNLLIDKAYF